MRQDLISRILTAQLETLSEYSDAAPETVRLIHDALRTYTGKLTLADLINYRPETETANDAGFRE